MRDRWARLLYNTLDVDGSGSLDRGEVTTLISQILGEEATPSVLASAFSEMDADNSGEIDFSEFAQFFDIDASVTGL